ncbi:MAG TPA: pseudouridine synthase [Terrimicrobiaceae bacterium]|nr:pseudouridine synthase [Terrimicrobiaceae bacterium]
MILAFHKPYGVLSQFTADVPGQRTLAEFAFPRGVYPLGRLDLDSEGLLLLSDEAGLNVRLLHPEHAHWRRYAAQVEGIPDDAALARLRDGVDVQGRRTLPARAWRLESGPSVPPRDPPIRFRKNIPTAWIALELHEGRNRQVRRMTAATGHATLRLIRLRIGSLDLAPDLAPGQWRELPPEDREKIFAS